MTNNNIYYPPYGGDSGVDQGDEQRFRDQQQPQHQPQIDYLPQQPLPQPLPVQLPHPQPILVTPSQWHAPPPRGQTPSPVPPEMFTQPPLYPQPLVPDPNAQGVVQQYASFLQAQHPPHPPQTWDPTSYYSKPSFQGDVSTPMAQAPRPIIHPQSQRQLGPQSTRFRPALSIALPHRQHVRLSPTEGVISTLPYSPIYRHGPSLQRVPQPTLESPYLAVDSLSVGSHSPSTQEYFPPRALTPTITPPFHQMARAVSNPVVPTHFSHPHSALSSPNSKRLSPDYDPSKATLSTSRSKSTGSSSKVKEKGKRSCAKTSRQQFTACGACRWRRVRCDLKARQEEADSLPVVAGEGSSVGPQRVGAPRKRVGCTNCLERGTNCVQVATRSSVCLG